MDDRAQRSRRQAWQLAATGSAPGSNLRPTATASAASAASTAASSRRSSSFYVSSAMTLAASQNLPAVLNDPNKGKGRRGYELCLKSTSYSTLIHCDKCAELTGSLKLGNVTVFV